ncbi:BolA family protein [Prochlorococcus marinus]|uniref:BolA family protein n=1 Tax=Prochlorococcus marinus TaxID=1219 RepID=UPI0022B47C17|nr:BolA family transcriptional regulator [Prochlorococcus marinus]
MVHSEEVISSIQEALPDAQVDVEDLSGGGGDHLNVNVVSSAFIGLTRVQQHQLIYKALKDELATEAIHALALKTSTP